MDIWEMCENVQDFYEIGEASYRVRDYSSEWDMDNIQAMNWFLEYVGFEDEMLEATDGTQMIVKVKDKLFQIDSSGFGDFFSHQFDVIDITDKKEM